MSKSIIATVTTIVPKARHGPYAVAACSDTSAIGSITFSLNAETWNEATHPVPGTQVHLSDLIKTRRGWRSQKARFLQLSDS